MQDRRADIEDKKRRICNRRDHEDRGQLPFKAGKLFDEVLFAEDIESQKIATQISYQGLAQTLYVKGCNRYNGKDDAGPHKHGLLPRQHSDHQAGQKRYHQQHQQEPKMPQRKAAVVA